MYLEFFQPDPDVPVFVADQLMLTDGTMYDPGNGALGVRGGDHFRLTYQDEIDGTPVADRLRIAEVTLGCEELTP